MSTLALVIVAGLVMFVAGFAVSLVTVTGVMHVNARRSDTCPLCHREMEGTT